MTNQIFGPVPSRRLGRSLGVDLVPFKTCTYDCIYCQLGRTTCKTMERKEWVALEDVLETLKKRLSSEPDYITLSGSGEPTLFSRLAELIDRIKAMTRVPVAVLTNGSLLWQEDVRRQLMNADLVIPSLDAGDEVMFRLVNRPHEEISFEQMLNGLVDFRREFRGEYWLEVFVIGAYTAIPVELAKVAKCVDRIGPDRVQLNRHPPAGGEARRRRFVRAPGGACVDVPPPRRDYRRFPRHSSTSGIRRGPRRDPSDAAKASLFRRRYCRRTRHAPE